MPRPRIHIVYEYGIDYRPYGISFIRLIRPFSHPRVQAHIDASFDLQFYGQPADLVILDRLWRPDLSLDMVREMVNNIRLVGAKFIYSLDDNFFDLMLENKGWPPREFLPIVEYMLRQAEGVLVTTPALRERLLEYNSNILVLPNALDERLLIIRHSTEFRQPVRPHRIIIGYMGTFTHDEDIQMVLPALQAVALRHPDQIELQIIGVIRNEDTKKDLQGLPIRFVYPKPDEHEYPLFMLWFTGHVQWDIAISPLCDTPFTRCKSDIKFLDYSAIGAAGIYSQSPAYTSTVRHMETGWLVENRVEAWEEALETLVTNETLRLEISQNATRYLYTERTLAQRAMDWVEAVAFYIGRTLDQKEMV